jgi:hypothetical protein
MKNLILIAAFLITASCGFEVKQAEDQSGKKLKIPTVEGEASTSFNLTDADGQKIYEGSLLFWDHAISIGQIEGISIASNRSRRIKADYLIEIGPIKARISNNNADKIINDLAISDAIANAPKLERLVAKKAVTESFFSDRLQKLKDAGSISEADFDHANNMFPLYCEYKLWELASNPQLKFNFVLRPTPLQMCEGYYAEAGYFADAKLCGAPTSESKGKNYFDCMWRDGILKSELFTVGMAHEVPSCDGKTGIEVATELLDSGDLEKAITDISVAGFKTISGYITMAILEGKSVNKKIYDKYPAFTKSCKRVFRRTMSDTGEELTENDDTWKFKSPKAFLTIAEVEKNDVAASPYSLLVLQNDDEIDGANWENLTKYIYYFAKRIGFTGDYPVSVADQHNNMPVSGTELLADEAQYEKVFPAIVADTDPVFAPIIDIDRKLTPAKLLATDARIEAELAVDGPALIEAENDFRTKIGENTGISGSLVLAPNAAVFLQSYVLRIKTENNKMYVEYKAAANDYTLAGCIDLATNTECKVDESVFVKQVDKILFDKESGKLIFEAKIIDPSDLNLAHLPRNVSSFSELDNKKITGKTFHMEFSHTTLDEVLDWVSGSAAIMAGSDVLYSGSTSMDNFQQQMTK